ncbi:unnamed protein product [Didymodactylos carnosus]|uniref:Uncharacterized protein n=1 Tax=Didymodactylos carnosus TaxID=1234261 RepID=A0A8S2IC26_9BILA|nr:unnamed protein product [Didymodactylos carnosus]CAF3738660.1 unnamed protein product [Didymodactylos carnosus]
MPVMSEKVHDTGPVSGREKREPAVTALEIYHAIQNNARQSNRMFCFVREITDRDDMEKSTKKKFIETEDDTNKLLGDLKKQITENREAYLLQFLNDFETLVKRQIDYHILKLNERNSKLLNDPLYGEVLEHPIQCKRLTERFHERNDIMNKVKEFVQSENIRTPLVIYGESGCGKSSIMAKLVEQVMISGVWHLFFGLSYGLTMK